MVEKTSFSKNIGAIRESTGLSQSAFAEKIGVIQGTVSLWERGDIRTPRQIEIIESIKEAFGVTEQDLFSDSEGFYAKLHGLVFSPKVEETAYLPLRGRVHAGNPQDEEEREPVMIPLPQSIADVHKNGFFLLVEGDCMDKVYPEGCHVLIDPDINPLNGAVAAVLMDTGEYVMRRIYKGVSAVILSPDSHNAEHKDIVIDGEHDLTLVGTVVWFQGEVQ